MRARASAPTPDASWSGYQPWAQEVAACRADFERTARRFWLIPEAIPLPARDDVSLLYSFCRKLDDAVDEDNDPVRARAALAAFRAELHGESPRRPLIAALVAGAERSGLPLACAEHLLDGMAFDLGHVRMADDTDLLRYAYRVSAAVGLMLAPLLGVRGHPAHMRVVDLGLALQVSNVLLGVVADARRGRVYLPSARLADAGLSPEDVLAQPDNPRLKEVARGLAELADRYYESAEAGAQFVPLRYRHGVLLLGRAYADLGRRAAAGRRTPHVPSGLPLTAKLGQLVRLAAVAGHPRVMGLLPAPPHAASLHNALPGSWPGVHR